MRTSSTALVLLAALVVGSSARADDPVGPAPSKSAPAVISEEAKRYFAAGVALLQDPEGERVEDAYRQFQLAYQISGSPKILGNMGFCAMRLERDGEAIDAYTRYLREVPDIDPDERAQIVRDVQTLGVGVARLAIEVNKPGVRLVDVRIPVRGERVTNTYGPVDGKIEIRARPGHHIITAKLPDHDDAVWELDATASSRDAYTFAMRERTVAANTTNDGSNRIAPWIVTGVGGAMLLGGAITGIIALGKTQDIDDRCQDGICPRSFDLEGERSSAKTFVRLTDVLLIGGGVVTAGGLAWLLFGSGSSEKKDESKPPVTARAPLPAAACSPDGCRMSLKVTF